MDHDGLPRSEWYSAAPDPAARPAAAPEKKKKPHTGARVAGIVACVLLLLAASVYVFSDHFRFRFTFRGADGDGERSISVGFPDGQNGQDGGGDGNMLPDGFGEDYRDYYKIHSTKGTVSGDRGASKVERTETGTDFRLTLDGVEGLREGTLESLYPDCLNSIVGVATLSPNLGGYYWGSGVILSEDGYILTNQHLVSGCDEAYVSLSDGYTYPALLVGEDAGTDLAVLKIDAGGLHPAVFGDSDALTVGERVFAIGNPVLPTLPGTLTDGIISGVSRNISGRNNAYPLIQHTAAINEGSSGGALFNMYGQVVGITNMKLVNRTTDVIVEDMCFAIPSATVKAVTDRLLAGKAYVRPGIGVTVHLLDEETAARYDLSYGLAVVSVSPGSDAGAKGIAAGDILLRANGVELHSTQDLLTLRDSLQEGDRITFSVLRDGETFDVEVRLMDLSALYES